jgi:hypothetical protein
MSLYIDYFLLVDNLVDTLGYLFKIQGAITGAMNKIALPYLKMLKSKLRNVQPGKFHIRKSKITYELSCKMKLDDTQLGRLNLLFRLH